MKNSNILKTAPSLPIEILDIILKLSIPNMKLITVKNLRATSSTLHDIISIADLCSMSQELLNKSAIKALTYKNVELSTILLNRGANNYGELLKISSSKGLLDQVINISELVDTLTQVVDYIQSITLALNNRHIDCVRHLMFKIHPKLKSTKLDNSTLNPLIDLKYRDIVYKVFDTAFILNDMESILIYDNNIDMSYYYRCAESTDMGRYIHKPEYHFRLIFKLITLGYLGVVKYLMSKIPRWTTWINPSRLLYHAGESGSMDMINYTINFVISITNRDLSNVLLGAYVGKHMDIVDKMIEMEADPPSQAILDYAFICECRRYGNMEGVMRMLNYGACNDRLICKIAVLAATSVKDIDIVNMLLDRFHIISYGTVHYLKISTSMDRLMGFISNWKDSTKILRLFLEKDPPTSIRRQLIIDDYKSHFDNY